MGLLSTYLDKYNCTLHDVTVGYTDASGNWVAQTDVESAFVAHVSDVSIKELEFIDPALVETGIRKLACESTIGIVPEDEITITEKSGESTSWEVHEKIYATAFLKKYTSESRESFLIRKKI
jgi:hypothetical protein